MLSGFSAGEKRPILADLADLPHLTSHDQAFFLVVRRLFQDSTQRVGDKRSSPELQMILRSGPIRRRHEDRVADGMTALDGYPCIKLGLADLFFSLTVRPSNGGGIKNDLNTLKRERPRPLRKPLVPTDPQSDLRVARLKDRKSEIAGLEVKTFGIVIRQVVGDMDLAILAQEPAVGIENAGGIEKILTVSFIKRGDNDNLLFLGDLPQQLRRRPRDRFRKIKGFFVVHLAEITRTEKFLETNDLCPLLGRVRDAVDCRVQISNRIFFTTHLNESNDDVSLRG